MQDGDGKAADETLELTVDRHRSFGRMAIVAGRTAAGERVQVLFQDAPGRCDAADLEALKKLPRSRGLAIQGQEVWLRCVVVAREENKEGGGAPVFQAGKLLEVSSRSRGYAALPEKEQRHSVFAEFVARELLPEVNGYVLEVAGGKGLGRVQHGAASPGVVKRVVNEMAAAEGGR